jgi:osmotically-inducible protein OsmY
MTPTQQVSDADLRDRILRQLARTPGIGPERVGVAVNDGAVTVAGQVRSYRERQDVLLALHRLGVTAVASELTIQHTWAARDDSDVARSVAEALAGAPDIPAAALLATVHQNIVTLMGEVSTLVEKESAELAVHNLPGVAGVMNAITVVPASSTLSR